MESKYLFRINKEIAGEIEKKVSTPFYIYDEFGIEITVNKLYKVFDWVPGGYKNFFAVKALPNPQIVSLLYKMGMGVDTSSMAELVVAERLGIVGEDIMFTANNVPKEDFKKALELGAIINFDDLSYLDFFTKEIGNLPELVCFRYNPGNLKEGNDLIGKPTESKYGLTKDQLFKAYAKSKQMGAKRFGLHTMVVSNMLKVEYLIDTARMLFELAVELKEKLDIELEFINLGGGLGIPYKRSEKEVDIEIYSKSLKYLYDKILKNNNLSHIKIVSEFGRYITGPHGYLITKVLHVVEKYKKYVGVDASMSSLMRPALYGAYHHITILGKEYEKEKEIYDITGSLCENNDKFAIDRKMPVIIVGDILILHDVGAHGHAMGFQYNGKLRPAEILLKKDKSIKLIRRAEELKDYFSTIVW